MSRLTVSLIAAAHHETRTIGLAGRVPWHIKADLRFFRKRTQDSVVIQGRKTYEGIRALFGRPLPERYHIVLSRSRIDLPGCITAYSPEESLREASFIGGSDEVFVIGGSETYHAFLHRADKIILTEVITPEPISGDARFPRFEDCFREVRASEYQEEGPYRFRFLEFERAKACA
jgi:dihydrofolate reductase